MEQIIICHIKLLKYNPMKYCVENNHNIHSCNLFNSIHTYRNTISCNELQMVITTQKSNCKTSYKSPNFSLFTCVKIKLHPKQKEGCMKGLGGINR
jgi:hypothetical protein